MFNLWSLFIAYQSYLYFLTSPSIAHSSSMFILILFFFFSTSSAGNLAVAYCYNFLISSIDISSASIKFYGSLAFSFNSLLIFSFI